MNEAQFEKAAELEAQAREDGIAKARITRKPPAGWDGETCVDCGEEIDPPKRAELGYCTCLTCAEIQERTAKHFGS